MALNDTELSVITFLFTFHLFIFGLTNEKYHCDAQSLSDVVTIKLHRSNHRFEKNLLASNGEDFEKKEGKKGRFPRLLQLKQTVLKPTIDVPLLDQILPSKKLATYYGEIGVGSNPASKFKVLFDTGSCEFWVPDQSCVTKQCARHNKYSKSASFLPILEKDGQPRIMDIEYLSGKLEAYNAYETVTLAEGITVPYTDIGFATKMDIPLLEDLEWDGIVGLGFKNGEITERGGTPFVDHMLETGALTSKNLKNQFGYYISNKGGALTLGGANKNFLKDPKDEFKWIDVESYRGYWTVAVLGIKKSFPQKGAADARLVDTKAMEGAQPQDYRTRSIFDTGTYLVYGPASLINDYLGELHIQSCDDTKHLPSISFFFKGSNSDLIEVTLTPEDYVMQFAGRNGRKECLLGIAPDEAEEVDNLGGWTFGQVFLKSYYTIFDRDNMGIGVARSLVDYNDSPNRFMAKYDKESHQLVETKIENGPIE